MTLICVLCADDYCVAIDVDTLKDCPPVLGRFLGLGDGFAPPETDDLGRLTFAVKFGIIRDRFLDCLAFVRCGRVHDLTWVCCRECVTLYASHGQTTAKARKSTCSAKC